MQNHVLVHNIGHHDFYLLLKVGDDEKIAVPINVHMHSISKYVYEQITVNNDITLERDPDRPDTIRFSNPINPAAIANKKVRHIRDVFPITTDMQLTGLLIPNLVPVVETMKASHPVVGSNLFVVIMTSGQESNLFDPDASVNSSRRDIGRSTYFVGKILKTGFQLLDPTIEIEHHHDTGENDFSFSNRPTFFRKKVIPYIDAIRKQVVDHYAIHNKEEWQQRFSVQLSINTGTTTVIISTLNALQHYQPDCIHVEQARSWPKAPFTAVYLPNRHLQQSPSITIDDIECPVQRFTVLEMQRWKKSFITIKPIRESKDHSTFFFRKGNKEVLALVTIRNQGHDADEQPYLAVRGVNIEVSLPTGTLCAERNAIGTAVMNIPNLQREDILCVAVLSLSSELGPRLGPCGACQEWLKKVSEVNPDLTILTFDDLECTNIYIDYLP